MGRRSSEAIFKQKLAGLIEEMGELVGRTQRALTRAKNEHSTALRAFFEEVDTVRGVPTDKYPESYWRALEKRDLAVIKMMEADEKHQDAVEALRAAKIRSKSYDASTAEAQYNDTIAAR